MTAATADSSTGHVWLVGGGPGDPGLLTLAGQRALAAADVVVYDALVSEALLRHCRPEAEFVFAGKRAGMHSRSQAEIEALLVENALAGRTVVRLKGGDPFVFGRGGEEAIACQKAGVPITVVPGVTSAVAAAAYAGIPVTHRGLSSDFMVITGSDAGSADERDWTAAARVQTLVVLMGAERVDEIMEQLVAAGRPSQTPAAFIQWGTTPAQRVVTGTVATIAHEVASAGLGAPAAIVIGEVVVLRNRVAWFRPGPLAARTVVVTRARQQASDLTARLEALGATVIEAPVMHVRYCPGDLVTDEFVASRWDWIVFASANGVSAFFAALAAAGRDARALGSTRVAAIGAGTTAALCTNGVLADFTPEEATSDALAAALPRVSGARVLLPASSLADASLTDALRRRGALVERVVLYETLPLPLRPGLAERIAAADAITFTSASTARFLAQALGDVSLAASTRLISIGPRTSAAVVAGFGRAAIEAATPSLDALVLRTKEALAWD